MSLSRHHLFSITVLAFELFTHPAFGQQLPPSVVSVSSENRSTGQLGIKALDGVIDGWPNDYTKEWATTGELTGAWIQLNWNSPVQVSRLVLWDRPNLVDNVEAGKLTFSDGSTALVDQLPNDASSGYPVSFSTKTISWLRFTVTQAAGENIGLSEFQVFGASSGGGGGGSVSGRVPFTRIVIDPNPPPTTLEKGLADIDGDGRLDAIIGFGNPPGTNTGQGLAWYENPHSGNPADTWLKHTIVARGVMYEDLKTLDVDHDGAPDIIASFYGGAIYWFRNPRGHGGNPATDSWSKAYIGTGSGENTMELADIDGDGKVDLVTNSAVFFQNNPYSWTRVGLNRTSPNGLALLDIGSGKGAINIVGMGHSPYPFVWLENPREHNGNARRDPWITHVIGPGYNTSGAPATYAAADLNGDGRMDVATAWAEGPAINEPVLWWEAPADRRKGTWIRHVIDPAYQCLHNLRAADIDGDGNMDIIGGEAEQSAYKRLTIFYGDGLGNFTQQVLTNGSGHGQVVGDVMGDGDLDILNAGHGWTGAAHPIELYLNERH